MPQSAPKGAQESPPVRLTVLLSRGEQKEEEKNSCRIWFGTLGRDRNTKSCIFLQKGGARQAGLRERGEVLRNKTCHLGGHNFKFDCRRAELVNISLENQLLAQKVTIWPLVRLAKNHCQGENESDSI